MEEKERKELSSQSHWPRLTKASSFPLLVPSPPQGLMIVLLKPRVCASAIVVVSECVCVVSFLFFFFFFGLKRKYTKKKQSEVWQGGVHKSTQHRTDRRTDGQRWTPNEKGLAFLFVVPER